MTIYRHRLTGVGAAGDEWNCTLHTESGNPIDPVHNQVVTSLQAFLTAHLQAMWNTHTASSLVYTDQLDSLGKNAAQRVSNLSVIGTGTGASVAQGTCMLVSWTSALPNRHGRGRMYLPTPDATHYQADGMLVLADCQTIANDAKALIASLLATTTPVLVARLTHTTTQISGAKVNIKPSFQRRRNNEVANNYQVGT